MPPRDRGGSGAPPGEVPAGEQVGEARRSARDRLWISRARPLISRLETLEQATQSTAFVHRGAWLVHPAFMPRVARFWLLPAERRLPGLRHAKVAGLVGRWLLPLAPPVSLRSAAEAIQLSDDGGRLRAVYLSGRPHSLKLARVTRRLEMRPDREVELRERVRALGTFRLPEVYASAVADGVAITDEELILGRGLVVPRDLPLVRSLLLPKLLATHRAAGFTQRPLSSHLPAELAERLPPGRLRDAVGGLLARDPETAVGFCHRDISPSNVIVTGGDTLLLDWENAGPGIVAFDLLALALRYPRSRALLSMAEEAVRSLLPPGGAGFEELLLLALALRVADDPAAERRLPGRLRRAAALA